MKSQTLLLLHLMCFSLLASISLSRSQAEANRRREDGALDHKAVEVEVEVGVGVIVDMGSWQGKVIKSCISMAISDFFNSHKPKPSKVKLLLHVRDSKGDPFRASSAAFNLLEDAKVVAILWAQTSLETKVLAEFGDRNKIPVLSFSTRPTSFPISTRHPYFVQIARDQTSLVKGVAALIELHKWRKVVLIHEENDIHDLNIDDDDDTISYMASFFEEKNIRIAFSCTISTSSQDDQIIEQLHELKALQTTVFIVHTSHLLASRLFVHAKRLGMISEGYAWIVTPKSMNHLQYLTDSSIVESMQGVIGFRSYSNPSSKELHNNVTSRLRRKFYSEGLEAMQALQLNEELGLLTYDAAWSLAKTAETALNEQISFEDFHTTSMYGSALVQGIRRSNFKGLGGEFRFINGKLVSNTFEIVNMMNSGEVRRVGFCTTIGKITREIHEAEAINHGKGRQLSFTNTPNNNNLEAIIWPGESSITPRGRMLQTSGKSKILKIGVPVRTGFREWVDVKRDPQTNATLVTGFSIDVFKAAFEGLKYQLPYEFIPFMDANGRMAGSYNDLVDQVYLKKFDAVVGDITITSSRSLHVDFTISYTDIGVGIVARTECKDMWIFFKPLTPQLWVSIIGFHIIIGFLIWLIELQSRQGLQVVPKRNGFPLSILIGRWDKLRNNWAVFVAAVSMFVLFILGSSYTATLASMMTVRQIELNSKRSNIGYLGGSNVTTGVLFSNLNFDNRTLHPLFSAKEYAVALSKGSKKGGVDAILDEMPYINIFLAQYSGYSLIKTLPTTNGFAFVFPKGSPLVPDISREIMRLRESGRLNMIETAWLKSQPSLTYGDSANKVTPLTFTNFGGLFLIAGILSIVAFLIFQIPLLYNYWLVVRDWMKIRLVILSSLICSTLGLFMHIGPRVYVYIGAKDLLSHNWCLIWCHIRI